jgi:hypothetical protein
MFLAPLDLDLRGNLQGRRIKANSGKFANFAKSKEGELQSL